MKGQKDVWEAYLKYQTARVKQLKEDPKIPNYQIQQEEMELEKVRERTKGSAPTESSHNLILKVPKGTRDFYPAQMRLRSGVINKITDIFQRHGALQIDTPVFELKDILTGKYGDDSKLIYDLKDQGGEILSLRYDLTVPFARYVAMNKVGSIKRYQIAKVYRRDNPAIARGRYREFYQCDFDVAGQYDSMIPDAEIVKLLDEILSTLNIGKFLIKINHRKILDGIFEVAGIPQDMFRGVSSSIDKLDKMSWEDVADELRTLRNLKESEINTISEFVRISGPLAKVLDTLRSNQKLLTSPLAKEGLDNMQLLIKYVHALEISDERVVFDLSLARGLDYYTGVIYEAIVETSGADEATSVGSIAGGGRYDNLVGMFDTNKRQVPCVGVSIGVERIFSILEQKHKDSFQPVDVDVYVASAQKDMAEHRLRIANKLWNAGFKAELSYKPNPKLLQQLQYCEDSDIPWVIVIGQDEVAKKVVKLRSVKDRKEVEVLETDMVAELQKRLSDNQLIKPEASFNCNMKNGS